MTKIIDVFLEHAQNKSDQLAFSDCSFTESTYSEVDIMSGRVYRYLKEHGIGKEDFVMILLPRGVMPYVAMIGVWKAGAAFVVLEEGYSRERTTYIFNDCGCRLTIDFELWQEIQSLEPYSGREEFDEHDAAFAVYTSGSTGNPKGVLHEYGNIDLIAKSQILKVNRVGQIAPTNFVASIIMLVSVIYQGVTLYIIPYSIVKNPQLLVKFYLEQNIDATFCTASVYRLFSQIHSLKNLVLSSEPVRGVWSEREDFRIFNFYTSSEMGFIATIAILDSPNENAPIGKPVLDLKITLRDKDGNIVADGEEGEICVQNPFVRGYINLPEQNKKSFVNGEYRSGDIGKKLENGDYIIIGRADDMVKINGNRVEPIEVEEAAKQLLGLNEVIVKGFTENEDAYLCLYFTDNVKIDVENARELLLKKLPYYMIPSHFIHIDEMPRNENGKISRLLLPKPNVTNRSIKYVAPVTREEKILCRSMEEVLSIDKVGIEDDFYTLGGSSISAMKLVEKCELADLNVQHIFRGRTPQKIAALYLDDKQNNDGEPLNERINKAMEKSYLLTDEQLYMFDYQLYTPKSTMLNLARLIRFNEEIDAERLCEAVNSMIKSHPALLTSIFFDEDGEIKQRYTPELFSPVIVEHITEKEMKKLRYTLVQPFEKLTGRPLVRTRVFKTKKAVYWFSDIHHMFFDGGSVRITLEDLCERYLNDDKLKSVEPDGYYLMLQERQKIKKGASYAKSREYFEKKYGVKKWSTRLECERDTRKNAYAEMTDTIDVKKDELRELCSKAELGNNGIFMLAEMFAMAALNNIRDVLIVWVYKGRDSKTLQSTVGLLFKELPVALSLSEETSLRDVYADLKKQISLGITHSDYPYIDKNAIVKTNDHFVFIYQQDNYDPTESMPIAMEEIDIAFPLLASETAMNVEVLDGENGVLYLFLEYSSDRYQKKDVLKFKKAIMSFAYAMVKLRNKVDATTLDIFKEAGMPFPKKNLNQTEHE